MFLKNSIKKKMNKKHTELTIICRPSSKLSPSISSAVNIITESSGILFSSI